MAKSSADEATVFPLPGRRGQSLVIGASAVVILAVAIFTGNRLGHALFAGGFVLLLGSLGAARAGIRCDSKGVALQRMAVTHRFTWAEIIRFENRGSHGIGVVRRADGWKQLASPRMFGKLSEQITEQLEQQRLLRQSS